MNKLDLGLLVLAGALFTLPIYAHAIAATGNTANSAATIPGNTVNGTTGNTPNNTNNNTPNSINNTTPSNNLGKPVDTNGTNANVNSNGMNAGPANP